ncbi:MAG: FAD:protein FMN transferase [Bdellovibrionales bacterium]|nr:FAD:protein FMN transferase [Bdellovibrionales bacterium]
MIQWWLAGFVLISIYFPQIAWGRGLSLSYESRVEVHGRLVTESRPLMGTVFTVSIWTPESESIFALRSIRRCFDFLIDYENKVSSWKSGSDTDRLNQEAYSKWVEVGPEVLELIGHSRRWNKQSLGAFDPGKGKLYAYWRALKHNSSSIDKREINGMLGPSGMDHVQVKRNSIRFLQPLVQLDFGGLGKGAAADITGRMLREAGFRNFVIDAGGDLLISGTKEGRDWRVGVQDPRRRGEVAHFSKGGEYALATSGDYERFIEIEGRRYSHIVDPRSGWPVQKVISATVLANNALDADALATAVTVLGAKAGLDLVNQLEGVEAYLIDQDQKEYLSRGWVRSGRMLRPRLEAR